MAVVAMTACKDEMTTGDSYISFGLSTDYSDIYMSRRLGELFKSAGSSLNLPDTNDFILTVASSGGDIIYKGPYGERPDPMQVSSGTYDVSLHSIEFNEPAFESPLFGDFRTVVLASGQTMSVAFGCTQLNCGMRLEFNDSFRDRFFSSDVFIRSDGYSLGYPYTESRIAYFQPGILNVVCVEGDKETPIVSRQLNAADILTIRLSASSETGGSFSVKIDTTRNWIFEDFTLGSGNDGSSMEKALKVADLTMFLGAEDVWVCGYIVGGDVSTSKVSFDPPFTKESHLALADNVKASTREECAAIELPSSGDMRDAVNLVDHPGYIGRKLYVKGDIENYFGYPGVKSIKEFLLE